MSKKLCAVLVVMLCLTAVLPAVSMSTGCAGVENSSAKSSAELKVDAWVENKVTKSGDIIEIYATTTYNEDVAVNAKIVKYNTEQIKNMLSYEITPTSILGIIDSLRNVIATVPLSYNTIENCWEGEYQIPKDLHGIYGVEVTATHGSKIDTDWAFGHWLDFYLNYLSPAIQKWEDFKTAQLEPFIQCVNESVHNLTTTFQTHGGLKGIVENLTELSQWQALLDACAQSGGIYSEYFSQNFSDNATILGGVTVSPLKSLNIFTTIYTTTIVNATVNITDPKGESYISEHYYVSGYYQISKTILAPPAGVWTVNVTTSGNGSFNITFYGEKYNLQNLSKFLEALTTFIKSSDYDQIISLKPELRSIFENISHQLLALKPLQAINYLCKYNFTNLLTKIAGSGNIVSAYRTLFNSAEYLNFLNALDSLKANLSEENLDTVISALQQLAESNYLQELLNSTAQYLQGNQTSLQKLIQSLAALEGMDVEAQFSALQNLSEFQNLMFAIMQDANLSEVCNSIKNTYHNIEMKIRLIENSTEFRALNQSIQFLMQSMGQAQVYEEKFNETKKYFKYNYAVADWVEGLKFKIKKESFDYSPAEINLTLTDPEGEQYVYTYHYYEIEIDKILYNVTPGIWGINITTYGNGSFKLEIKPINEFLEYMLLETLDELFFVLNAGIAIETESFAQIGTNATAKLIAYDVDGKLPYTTINVSVVRSPFEILESVVLYACVSGMMVPSGGVQQEERSPAAMEMLPPEMIGILQLLDTLKTETVYEGTVTTDANGEYTITFPVEEYGLYSIYAGLETDTKLGFGTANVFCEQDVPEITLQKLGEFSGIPVYKSPNKVGEDITLSVDVPQGAQVAAFVVPLPLEERYPEINVTYEQSFNFTNVTGNISLQVNGPVSIIGLVTGDLSAMQQASSGVSSVQQLPTIPQINVSYGILLASDVDVTLTIPTLVKGGTSTICLSAQGTIGNTSGLAFYADGNDFTAFDLSLFSKLIYRYGILGKEPSSPTEPLELLSGMTGIVWGSGGTANVKLPTLCAYGNYSIITVSAVDSQFGVGFAQAGFYKSLAEATPTSTTQTVAGKTLSMNYVCTAPITATAVATLDLPSAASQKVPAGKKIVGMGLELNTTGTVGYVNITVHYNESDIAGLDENSLRMYFWNETTNEWDPISDSGVWADDNIVWANVTHLTIFAPMAEEVAAAPSLLGPIIYTGVIAAIIAVLIVSVAVVARKRKKVT